MHDDRRSRLVAEEDTGRLCGGPAFWSPRPERPSQEATLAIRSGLGVHDLVETFHSYLAKATKPKLAGITFTKDVKQLSCCAAWQTE